MYNSINRFKSRLFLNKSHTFELVSIFENKIQSKHGKNKPILELYHTIRDDTYKEVFEKIKENNFTYGMYGNKGPGVYMANHSRYSFGWGYNDDGIRNVIISDVVYQKEYVKRYRSEIYSPCFNSEYVITKPELIYPRYFITYRINSIEKNFYKNYNEYENWGYVQHGKFGCIDCDNLIKRCDCELESYDEFDIIYNENIKN